jgi:hypothetical protein
MEDISYCIFTRIRLLLHCGFGFLVTCLSDGYSWHFQTSISRDVNTVLTAYYGTFSSLTYEEIIGLLICRVWHVSHYAITRACVLRLRQLRHQRISIWRKAHIFNSVYDLNLNVLKINLQRYPRSSMFVAHRCHARRHCISASCDMKVNSYIMDS